MTTFAGRRTTAAVVVLALLVSACSRYVDSRDPIRSLPADLPTPINVQLRVNSGSVALSWETIDSSAAASYRVYAYDSTYALDTPALTPVSHYDITGMSITISDLAINQRYFFTVVALSTSGLQGAPSLAVSTRLSHLSLIIENERDYTKTKQVVVEINVSSSGTHLILSEDSTFTDAVFKSMTFLNPFTLSNGDGTKTIYGRIQFANGTQSGDLLLDDIILDTKVAIDSIKFTQSDSITTGDSINFYLYPGEAGGEASVRFGTVSKLEMFDDGIAPDLVQDDSIYSAKYAVPLQFGLSNAGVTGSFTDAAGNSISQLADQTLSILSQPIAPNLTAATLSSFEIELSWSGGSASDFLSWRIYRDTMLPVDLGSDLIESIHTSIAQSYIDNGLDDSTSYYYKVYIVARSGLMAASNEDSATTDTNVATRPVFLSGGIAIVEEQTVALLSWTINNDNDFAYYAIKYDTLGSGGMSSPATTAIINNRNVTTYTAFLPTDTSRFRIDVFDRHGLSEASNIIILIK